jgi:hypothetical protein
MEIKTAYRYLNLRRRERSAPAVYSAGRQWKPSAPLYFACATRPPLNVAGECENACDAFDPWNYMMSMEVGGSGHEEIMEK